MYSLTISSMPFPQERYKDKNPDQAPIWGAEVAKGGLIRSLLRHAACDGFYLLFRYPHEFRKARNQLSWYPNHDRVEPILLDDYHRLRGHDRMVMFHPGSSGADGIRNPAVQGLINLRAFKGRPYWPITGLTHSISGEPGFWVVFEALLEALRSYDALVCTSEAGRKAIEQMMARMAATGIRKYGKSKPPRLQLPLIPLGTDAEQYQPRDRASARARAGIPPEPVVVLYVGRFSTHYKADLFPLVLAFSRLAPEIRAKAELVLAGDDVRHGLSPRLETFAAALGVSNQVRVIPNPTREYKTCLYNAADVFVSPSDSVQETFGQTVIEAMASGLPVIASDWDGYRDTVMHGATGFLVPTYWADCFDHLRSAPFLHDSLDLYKQLGQAASLDMRALNRYLEQLIHDHSLRKRLGEAGRRRVLATYDWPVIIEQYDALWLDLIERGTHAHYEKGGDDLNFDYLDVFRHHATKLVTKDSRVQVSDLGAALADGASDFPLFESTELSGNADECSRIIAACGSEKGTSVSELVRRVSEDLPELKGSCFQQIARMLKYGVLELC